MTFNIISLSDSRQGTIRYTIFFSSTFTKVNLKEENMLQLNPDKIIVELRCLRK